MSEPSYVTKISLKEYYSGYIQCPKCHAKSQLDTDPALHAASDVTVDRCPECDTFILMYISIGEQPVRGIIEGFTDRNKMEARVGVLAEKIKHEHKRVLEKVGHEKKKGEVESEGSRLLKFLLFVLILGIVLITAYYFIRIFI